jgi:D-3-phosphoglycerate dehydrogenase
MSDTVVESLILDLLEWLAGGERSYGDTMDAWRTSCPRLPVREDANHGGLVIQVERNGRSVVTVTPLGEALLAQRKSQHRAACGHAIH